jgi:hypothetical protein
VRLLSQGFISALHQAFHLAINPFAPVVVVTFSGLGNEVLPQFRRLNFGERF